MIINYFDKNKINIITTKHKKIYYLYNRLQIKGIAGKDPSSKIWSINIQCYY